MCNFDRSAEFDLLFIYIMCLHSLQVTVSSCILYAH